MSQPGHQPFASVRSLATSLGAAVVDLGHEAFTIEFVRPPLRLKVTVAVDALEWFLDVDDEAAGLRYRDWCDYTGYDRRPPEVLAAEMAGHLRNMLPALAAGEFRIVPDTASWFCPVDRLEWRVDGEWVEFHGSDTA